MPDENFFEDFKDSFSNGKLDKIKIAVVAGASEALKIKAKNFRKTDEEVIKEVVKNLNSIVRKIDS